MGRFCAKCGSEGECYIHGLCQKCFWQEHLEEVPAEFTVTFCKECFSQLQGKRRVRRRSNNFEEDVIEAAKAELFKASELAEGIEIYGIKGEALEKTEDGLPRFLALKVALREGEGGTCTETASAAKVKYTYCSSCDSAARGKYDAVVQVRAGGRTIDDDDKKIIERAFEVVDRKTRERGRQEITEIKEKEGGIDVKFVSLQTARIFAGELHDEACATVSESPKLIGLDRSTGGRTYRNTISVRFPSLRAGDIASFGGKVYRITGFSRGRFLVEDMGEKRLSTTISLKDMDMVRVFEPDEIKRVRLEAKTQTCSSFYDMDEDRFIELPAEVVPKNMQEGDEGILLLVGSREQVFKTRSGFASQ